MPITPESIVAGMQPTVMLNKASQTANRANVNRLKPMLQKRSIIEARGLAARNPLASSMTDQELEDALALNWTVDFAWEVTRRLKIRELDDWRRDEPVDDMEAAESEVTRGV